MTRSSLTTLPLLVLTACAEVEFPAMDTADSAAFEAEEKSGALGRLPEGLTCGLIYYRGSIEAVTDLYCGSYQTRRYSSISSYTRVSTGDWGLSSGQGYYHMDRNSNSSGLNNSDSRSVYLPAGAVCGLGHSRNASSETCMGYTTLSSCPSGWTRRTATDDSASGGYWHWCEYQDPNNLCTASSCYASSSLPRGTICGLGDNGGGAYGTCLGRTVTSGGACPSGYAFYGRYDRGASSGYGLGWCAKS